MPVSPQRASAQLKFGIGRGNPLVDSANSRRVKQAYEQLEFLVYPGLFMEEPA